MKAYRQPPSIEAIACVVLLITLVVCSVCYAVQRSVAKAPAYRVWEYTNIYADSGEVRKCIVEAPDQDTAVRCMMTQGVGYNPTGSIRPCCVYRTRIASLERVP